MLERKCTQPVNANKESSWKVLVLKEKTHRETADILRKSAFLANVNCREAFNTTVPEAMAAGCIPICYDAYGGRDFLENGINAYVFPNNHIYPLLEKLFELMDNYDSVQEELSRIRNNAFQTACRYREEHTEKVLTDFYTSIIK